MNHIRRHPLAVAAWRIWDAVARLAGEQRRLPGVAGLRRRIHSIFCANWMTVASA